MTDKQTATPTLANPILYIIARTDIPQMNPGKLAAQVAHAGTAVTRNMVGNMYADRPANYTQLQTDFNDWLGPYNFGVKIVLEATEAKINDFMEVCDMSGMDMSQYGKIVDPTYPMKNHYNEFFTREELTCMYVFADRYIDPNVLAHLKSLPLHR